MYGLGLVTPRMENQMVQRGLWVSELLEGYETDLERRFKV